MFHLKIECGCLVLVIILMELSGFIFKISKIPIQLRITSGTAEVDGLRVQRVTVPELSLKIGQPVYFYEVVDWKWWELSSGESRDTSKSSVAPVYVVGSFTYGAKLWPACLAVSYLLLSDKSLIQGKSVLDMGSGVGLASTTAAICGASKVVAADISPLTLKLVAKAANELNLDKIETLEFDILNKEIPLPCADLVLFADVLYTPQLARGVAQRVAEAKARGDWIIVGSMRGREGREPFVEALAKLGIMETFRPPSDDIIVALPEIGWKRKEVEILEINRPASSS